MSRSNETISHEPTMFEIAQLAGVSESTVSRALSGSTLVNEETRNRILKIAHSINYRVNINARNLRQKRTRTIEVLIPLADSGRQHMSDPFYLDMLGVLADALASRQHDMLLTKKAPWAKDLGVNSIMTGRSDGMIIMGQGQDLEALREFTKIYPEVIVWGGHLHPDDYVVVGTDNVAGGKLATEHLMKLGRKRIAFLGDMAEPEISLRQQGYRKAHEDNGVHLDERLIFSAPFDAREARTAADRMIQSGVEFDAIFCASDVIAMSAITSLRTAGIEVPRDVAIVGYDNIMIAASFGPSITTVSQRIQEGGEIMVDLLLQLIEGKEVQTTLMPVELIVRESCGA